ncbi:MAG TPA: YraN family protein [Glaciihabitans sp.]|nr:YraN family protein [Glaciihabitans sp.]
MAAKDELGRRGEVLAVAHLEEEGLDGVGRNWRCRLGEIDVIARDGGQLVFVEVKTRSSVAFGTPLDAITLGKLARLRRLAAAWCAENRANCDRIRIDAIGIVVPNWGPVQIDHLKNVS